MKTVFRASTFFGVLLVLPHSESLEKRFILTFSTCQDAIPNCKDYDPSVCTSADYHQWASQNCQNTCNMCPGGSSGGGNSGIVTLPPGAGITGMSVGCVYNSQVYQQGQTWRDGCQYTCQCVDASTGKYQCNPLCLTWQLPPECHFNPPAPGKCCKTPECPPGYNLQYPPGYTEQ